jgi:hypothetical protein
MMQYNPAVPFHERYVKNPAPLDPKLTERVEKDAITLCRALGYDLNTVEFAVEDGVPYAIDFMNPAPDADVNSVGQENFDWIVNAVADLAIRKAQSPQRATQDFRWSAFLNGEPPKPLTTASASTKKTVRRGDGAVPRKARKAASPPK